MTTIMQKVDELLTAAYKDKINAIVVQLNINYNYIKQQHTAHIMLSNGKQYRIDENGITSI